MNDSNSGAELSLFQQLVAQLNVVVAFFRAQAGEDFVATWQGVQGSYDQGGEAAVLQFDDTGAAELVVALETGGTLTVQSDPQSAQDWDDAQVDDAPAPGPEWRAINRPDGLQELQAITDGQLTARKLIDQADTKDWESVINHYQDSQRTQKDTVYDDGTQRLETYAAGIRSTSLQTDAADIAPWSEILTEYASDGALLCRTTIFDNGVEKTALYDDDAVLATRQVDGFDAISTWAEVDRFYDLDGALTQQVVRLDDGPTRVEDFAGGARTGLSQYDTGDAEVWETRTFAYDAAGQTESRLTVFDNADKSLMLYTDGSRFVRYEQDGDGSDDWLYRVTTYVDGAVGGVATFTQTPVGLPGPLLTDPGTDDPALTLWDHLVADQGVHGDDPPPPDEDLGDLIFS